MSPGPARRRDAPAAQRSGPSSPLRFRAMAIAATLLFGSVARADHSESSDTDLLMINLGEETRHVSVGHLSLFQYPWSKLEKDAHDGDLFICHLVHEAKPLIDPDDYLPKLRGTFRYRSTYQDDINRATDLGWYLVKFGDELNSSLQAKRALWCIRTILIARSAEQRDPIFAPQRLAERTCSPSARDLLSNRHQRYDGTALRSSLRRFLEDEAPPDPSLEHADRAVFVRKFARTSNKVALQTLRQEEESQLGYVG